MYNFPKGNIYLGLFVKLRESVTKSLLTVGGFGFHRDGGQIRIKEDQTSDAI